MARSRVRGGWHRPDDNGVVLRVHLTLGCRSLQGISKVYTTREDYVCRERSSAVFAQSMAYVPSSIHTPYALRASSTET